ncbi:MlaE family ABC transporter permease, partial [Nocardia wallacei]|uniref:MlaE family ABC transporter permease n=1 Tax=Nocardia wallacei TaxID=480035 RepID=UPI002457E0AD
MSTTDLAIRTALRRNFSETVLSSLATLGRAIHMGAQALRIGVLDVVRLRFQVHETLAQAWFLIKVTAIPSILMAIPFGVIVSAQVGNIVSQLGADSMIGAAGGLGVIKQGAPMAAAMLLGGAGSAAIAADLGARTIREEVDDMRVMGVDQVQRLVVPLSGVLGGVAHVRGHDRSGVPDRGVTVFVGAGPRHRLATDRHALPT